MRFAWLPLGLFGCPYLWDPPQFAPTSSDTGLTDTDTDTDVDTDTDTDVDTDTDADADTDTDTDTDSDADSDSDADTDTDTDTDTDPHTGTICEPTTAILGMSYRYPNLGVVWFRIQDCNDDASGIVVEVDTVTTPLALGALPAWDPRTGEGEFEFPYVPPATCGDTPAAVDVRVMAEDAAGHQGPWTPMRTFEMTVHTWANNASDDLADPMGALVCGRLSSSRTAMDFLLTMSAALPLTFTLDHPASRDAGLEVIDGVAPDLVLPATDPAPKSGTFRVGAGRPATVTVSEPGSAAIDWTLLISSQ